MSEHDVTQVLPPYDGDVDMPDDDDEIKFPPSLPSATANVLDALKAQRARAVEERTYDVVVPGWGDLLVLRLGAITGQQQQRLVERAQRRTAQTNADADFLIAAFREVLGRATPQGELAVLVDADGDQVGLDERLAHLLDLGPVRRARDVLDLLFARANSPSLAIASAANEWLEWARSASDEIDEDFLGE
jgi:hypothetical protein